MPTPSYPIALSSELIIRLIKEDLKFNKLLLGLNQLGLVAEPYHSDLGSIIMILMGLPEDDDQLYAFYQNQLTNFTSLETSYFHYHLDTLAQEFYQELLNKFW